MVKVWWARSFEELISNNLILQIMNDIKLLVHACVCVCVCACVCDIRFYLGIYLFESSKGVCLATYIRPLIIYDTAASSHLIYSSVHVRTYIIEYSMHNCGATLGFADPGDFCILKN